MWTRYDTNTLREPKLARLSRSDRYLYMEMLAWANDQQTDGFIERAVLRQITDLARPLPSVGRMVVSGALKESDNGWIIVGFFDDQLTTEEVAKRHEKSQISTERSRRHKGGDHSKCDPQRCHALKGVTHHEGSAVTEHYTKRHETELNETPKEVNVNVNVSGEAKNSTASPDRTAMPGCAGQTADRLANTSAAANKDIRSAQEDDFDFARWYESLDERPTETEIRAAVDKCADAIEKRYEKVPAILDVKPATGAVEIRLAKKWWKLHQKWEAEGAFAVGDHERGLLNAAYEVIGNIDVALKAQYGIDNIREAEWPQRYEIPAGSSPEKFANVVQSVIPTLATYTGEIQCKDIRARAEDPGEWGQEGNETNLPQPVQPSSSGAS